MQLFLRLGAPALQKPAVDQQQILRWTLLNYGDGSNNLLDLYQY